MTKYYIAAFVPEEDGSGYSVYFPDVPRCFTGGETLEEAMFMAEDVLRLVLQDMAAERKEIPAPSGLEAVRKKVEEERALDGLSTPADTVYQLVAAPELDMVPVKVTISVPRSALDEIDKKAKEYGFTRSGLIVRAAQEYRQASC